MSRDFDDIRKKIDQSHRELHKQDIEISRDINDLDKNQEKILKEIHEIKKDVRDIAFKVDTMLEILNNFSIMLVEDDEDMENYDEDEDENESWITPDQEEEWNNFDEDDEGE